MFAASCATGPLRPATPEESVRLIEAWGRYRESALARGPLELFYDASVSRRFAAFSGELAVRDAPGSALTLHVTGPLGTAVARADWEGGETRVYVASGRPKERLLPAGADLSGELGVALTPKELSWLLYGLPETAPPESAAFSGDIAWLSWRGGAIRCSFDPAAGRVGSILYRESGTRAEVRFLEWSSGFPSRIRIRTSHGGSADLTLHSAEPGAA